MKQLFIVLIAFLRFVGELIAVLIKFLVFVVLSPFTFWRCIVHIWKHRSFKQGWFKFSWIWGAYWNKFNL